MKRFPVILLLAVLFWQASAIAAEHKGNKYSTDEQRIEDLFNGAEDITLASAGALNDLPMVMAGKKPSIFDEDKHMIAGIVALAEIVLGVGILIPIHRIILGMGGEEVKVIALYCITLGGCGIITLVDGILLLMDIGGSQYIENPKFIMW